MDQTRCSSIAFEEYLSLLFQKIGDGVPLSHEEACDLIGKFYFDKEGVSRKIIGVDNRPPKCTDGIYLRLYNAENKTLAIKVG